MKSLLYLVACFAAVIVANGSDHDDDQCPRKRNGCLCQNDVNHILDNWPRLFDTEDADWLAKNINCTVAEDFVSYNEGSMIFGVVDNGINIPSRADLLHNNLINIQYEAGFPNTRGNITKVAAFHGCDHIAFRWMYNGMATGNTKCTSAANTEKHAIEYKGIDLLTIKVGTLQVEKVMTSADGVIFSLGIGADFSGSPICPGTKVPPPDTTCPMIAVGGSYPPIEPHAAC